MVEEHYLENKEQILREEDRVIQMYINDPMCLNSKRAWTGLSDCEYNKIYKQNNLKQIQENRNTYYQEKRNIILEKMRTYREINQYRINERKKEKRKENHDHILQLERENRLKRADKIYEKRKEKYECPCGSTFRHDDKARHDRSKKHIAWIKDQKQEAETI